MNNKKIKSRNVMFTFNNSPDWNLNLHLILGEKYNYIIDTGFGTKTVEPIKEYMGNNEKPIIVINTHYHWDHIWGNGFFKDSIIISHKLCREIIEKKWDEMLNKNSKYIDGETELCLPNLVFDNELYFPEDKIKIFYTPGHTIDCISVLDEVDKVLNAGDNIGDDLNNIVPSIDTNIETYKETLKKYQNLDFDTCISGHNVVLSKSIINDIIKCL